MTKFKAFLAVVAALSLVSSTAPASADSRQEHRAGARRLGRRIRMEAHL
jgi:hypothetical protein